MHPVSPTIHCYKKDDAHSPILSIRSVSPLSSPRKTTGLVKSTSIVITSTSRECSPVHSPIGQKYVATLHREITNAFQITPKPILESPSKIKLIPNKNHSDESKSVCKTVSHDGSWKLFRRDKVAPLKIEDCGPIIHTYPTPYTSISFETSTEHSDTTNTTITDYNSGPDLIPKSHSNPFEDISANTNLISNNNPTTKSPQFLPLFRRQETISATDTSAHPFTSTSTSNNATHIMSCLRSKSDSGLPNTLARPNSEQDKTDLSFLSVPQNGSVKNIEDSITISTIPGSGSTVSVARSLESKFKLSAMDRSSLFFMDSPIGSRNRKLSEHQFDDVTGRCSPCACTFTNLSTTQGRQFNAAMILVLSVAPIIALLIQNCINLYRHNNVYYTQESIKSDILYSVEIGNVMHYTQIERGTTVLYWGTQGNDEKINTQLSQAYHNTDTAIKKLSKWLSEKDPPHFQTVELYWNRIKNFRRGVRAGTVTDVENVLEFYSDDNSVIMRWIGKSVQLSTNGDLWRTLIGYYMLIISKEQAGVERALGGFFYASGGFTNARLREYLKRQVTGMNFLTKAEEYVKEVKDTLDTNYRGRALATDLSAMRDEIVRNSAGDPDSVMARKWFDDMTKYIDILKVIQDKLASGILSELNADIDELRVKVVEATVMIAISFLLFPFVIISVYRLTKRIQAYAEMLHERSLDLDLERKRSELLLYELLPPQVAQKLLSCEEVTPMSYKSVTIFFSDIVGFTSICSRSTPMQVIDMLNSLYRIFDDIISSYRVYKVETIGDAYMVASGVPEENRMHATEIAGVALDMRDSISHLMVNHLPDEKLQLRIGINSGPVVAGVVGHKMPRYCLFGDTVNVASRMESTSLPLRIQISNSTKRELERWGCFEITTRGNVEIKGKGMMTTYWLAGRDNEMDGKRQFRPQGLGREIAFMDEPRK